MRKCLLLFVVIMTCLVALSQNSSPLMVKDFVQNTTEKVDKEMVPKRNWTDNDNNPICLIKVKASGFESSIMQKFLFVPSGLEITHMVFNNNQWYLYVSSKKIGNIKIVYMGDCVYRLPNKLEPNAVYVMTLGMETATLVIKATPEEAEIYVDDEKVGVGYVNMAVSLGAEHRYRVKCEDYFPKEGVMMFSQQTEKTLDVELEPNFGWITVITNPDGADVFVDGKKVGVTPYVFEKIKRGNHKIELRKERFATHVQMVTIQNGEPNNDLEDITLEVEDLAYGKLELYSTPDDADIIIDGAFKGKTPLSLDIVVGTHDVMLSKMGYNPTIQKIEIEEGESAVVNVVLTQSRDIIISTDADGDKVFVDGKYSGVSPLTVTLNYGEHEIVAIRGGSDEETNLNVIMLLPTVKSAKQIVNIAQVGGDGDVYMQLRGNEIYNVNGVTFKMIAVQGGTFGMGTEFKDDDDAKGDETPKHDVTLSDYYIGEVEVTQELWKAVMGSRKGSFKGTNMPVDNVNWNDCQKFIQKLNELTGGKFRLPTEAEWEFAARGGVKSKGYRYSGSNNVNEVAWYSKTTNDQGTKQVASKLPNELGIYDMSGNVHEWCSDYYGDYHRGKEINPQGPSSGNRRVVRGGSWYIDGKHSRVTARHFRKQSESDKYIGFRLAADK